MLDAASFPVLWQISDATGVRPEWLLPVLYNESGFEPSRPNDQGYPYYGLNQIAGTWLADHGIGVSDYLTWPASEQLSTVVLPYVANQVAKYGALRSGVKVALANAYPAALAHASNLSSTVYCKPAGGCPVGRSSDAYCANAGLDFDKSGCVTIKDLATWVRRAATATPVRSAIASAYALRPSEVQSDATLGYDYRAPVSPLTPPSGPSFGPFFEGVVIASAAVALALNLPRLRRLVLA
jgi:hypothetical protein